MGFIYWGLMEKTLRLDNKQRHIQEEGAPQPQDLHPLDFEEYADEDNLQHLEILPRNYGLSSILHSLVERSMFVQPIFDYLGDNLEVERKDPQGRTLFLAACHSLLGLDAATDSYQDLLEFRSISGSNAIRGNPYPQPENPWRQCEAEGSIRCSGVTFLDFYISHGANLFVVDNYGRNALHQMLDDQDGVLQLRTPPFFDNSLSYLLENCPSLINQPDNAGVCPLHLALRRMTYSLTSLEDRGTPPVLFRFETAVNNLLAAGPSPLTKDNRGNTVIHFLAASRLGACHCYSLAQEQRRFLGVFLNSGVDPQARNSAGMTALEILFTCAGENSDDCKSRLKSTKHKEYHAACKDVLDKFEQAGYALLEPNADGKTLLYLVAGLGSNRACPWFKLLEAKGFNSMTKDKEGRTLLDIAKENSEWMKDLEKSVVPDYELAGAPVEEEPDEIAKADAHAAALAEKWAEWQKSQK